MRVLVTGARGAIGEPVCRALRAAGDWVRALDRIGSDIGDETVEADIEDAPAVRAAARDIDAIVHLAAQPHDVPFPELVGPNVLGVFRQPQSASGGQDDALVDGLMQLILDIRSDARKTKNWGVADKIRDALKSLNIVVEDGKEAARWSRG